MPQCIPHTLSRFPPLPLLQLLHPSFPNLFQNLRISLLIIHRQKHILHTPQIRRPILLKTIRHKRSRSIHAREEMITASWAIMSASRRNVIDRTIQREVDWEIWVRAVVAREIRVG